jgi:hypothetical protein
MANDKYKVLQAATVWHEDPSQGKEGSDKVYSVQLLEELNEFGEGAGKYRVESQYGKRGYNLKSAPTTHTGSHIWSAESAYNTLLQTKVKGKKGDAYDKVINPPIIPEVFGGAGYNRAITKAQERETAKQVDALYDFLSGGAVEEKIFIEYDKPAELDDSMQEMLKAFRG